MLSSDPNAGYTSHQIVWPRTHRYGVLGTVGPSTQAIWIALHGYGERADLMVRRSRWPVSPTRCFVFPEAPHRFYLTEGSPPRAHQDLPVGASWMTRDLREHDIEDNLRYLDAVVDRVGDLAPQADVRVLGFSQGGATAVRWAAARAASGRTVARLVVWGSLLPPDVTLSGAAPLAQAPLDLVMGTRDRWVSEERFAAEVERVVQAGAPVLVHRFEGGHRFDDTTLAAVVADASS